MSELVVPGREGEFFTLFGVSDKVSSWVGPVLVGVVVQTIGEPRWVFLYQASMFVGVVPLVSTACGWHASARLFDNYPLPTLECVQETFNTPSLASTSCVPDSPCPLALRGRASRSLRSAASDVSRWVSNMPILKTRSDHPKLTTPRVYRLLHPPLSPLRTASRAQRLKTTFTGHEWALCSAARQASMR